MTWTPSDVLVVAPPIEADVQSLAFAKVWSTWTPEDRQAFVTRTYYVIRTGPSTWGVVERSNYEVTQSPWSRSWSRLDETDCDLLFTTPSVAIDMARSLATSDMAPSEWDGRPRP